MTSPKLIPDRQGIRIFSGISLKKLFLILSSYAIVGGIGTIVFSYQYKPIFISDTVMRANIEVSFLESLKQEIDQPEALSKYIGIISTNSKNIYLDFLNTFNSDDYLYNKISQDLNYESEYRKQVGLLGTPNPSVQKELRDSICADLESLTKTTKCSEYFNSLKDFNELRSVLKRVNKSGVDAAIDSKIKEKEGSVVDAAKKINSADDERQKRISLGGFLLAMGFLFLIPTLIVYWAANLAEKKEKRQELEDERKNAERNLMNNIDSRAPWQSASMILRDYYSRNLDQITKIYDTSIKVMTAGFVLIVASISLGIFLASQENNTEQRQQITSVLEKQGGDLNKITPEQLKILLARPEGNSAAVIALIGVGAGIITNFLGATFLFLYQSTLKQASEYTQALNKTSIVGVSIAILTDKLLDEEKIGDQSLPQESLPQDIKNKIIDTKIEIARLIVSELQEIKAISEKGTTKN